MIGNLVAHPGGEGEAAAIAQLGNQLAFAHQQDMPPLAPMVGQIMGAIFHHTDADVAHVDGAPQRMAGFAGMPCEGKRVPVRQGEGQCR